MTLDEIKAELKAKQIPCKGLRKPDVYLSRLNEARAKVGESPATLDASEQAEEIDGDDVEVTMTTNVLHDGERYLKDKSYRVEDDIAETFKTNGWAK